MTKCSPAGMVGSRMLEDFDILHEPIFGRAGLWTGPNPGRHYHSLVTPTSSPLRLLDLSATQVGPRLFRVQPPQRLRDGTDADVNLGLGSAA